MSDDLRRTKRFYRAIIAVILALSVAAVSFLGIKLHEAVKPTQTVRETSAQIVRSIPTEAPKEIPVSITYIGNKNSKVFHNPTCSYLPAQKNRVSLTSRDEAINKGYRPCGHCKP